jgi:hypothetical protein
MMEHILILEPSPKEISDLLSRDYHVHHATHPYQIKSLVSALAEKGERISFLLCMVRAYHPRIFDSWANTPFYPRLILVRAKLDKMAPMSSSDPIGYWKVPYLLKDFNQISASDLIQGRNERERIHLLINRRIIAIPVSEILLIRKMSPGQVLIHAKEGDHLVNANLTSIESMFPAFAMDRISDQLLVPYGMRNKIGPKGYAFRGGYIPIKDRYLKTRKKLYNEELLLG